VLLYSILYAEVCESVDACQLYGVNAGILIVSFIASRLFFEAVQMIEDLALQPVNCLDNTMQCIANTAKVACDHFSKEYYEYNNFPQKINHTKENMLL